MNNYHTHTKRCQHAGSDDDEAFVLAAIEAGFGVLGFSDHSPWPFTDGFVSDIRMDVSEFPEYVASIRALQEKYKGRIRIECGLECEYYPQFEGWLKEAKKSLDYVILGEHFAPYDIHGEHYYAKATEIEKVEEYAKVTTEAMRTGLYCYLCHPDLPLANYPAFDAGAKEAMAAICEEAKALDMPLEYNMYGIDKNLRNPYSGLGYPAADFWKLAGSMGLKAIIGVDAHRPFQLGFLDRFAAAKDFLLSTGVRLIEERP